MRDTLLKSLGGAKRALFLLKKRIFPEALLCQEYLENTHHIAHWGWAWGLGVGVGEGQTINICLLKSFEKCLVSFRVL